MCIYERLQLKDFPSKSDLIEAVREMGEDIAERTLDRYRENMLHEFGWYVKYNHTQNGYELLIDEDGQDPKIISEIFGQSIRATFLSQATDRQAREIILFENRNDYPGIQYLNELYKACRDRLIVEISHQKFQSEEIRNYLIHPVFLKEYQNRWYVIAWVPGRKDYRSFGLERILSMNTSNETFKIPPKLTEEREFYDKMVGVNKAGKKLEKVRIRFWGIGVDYERTLPLHHSGRIVETGDDWAIFEYSIIPNFEFIQRVLAQADRVEVLQPTALKKQIKDFLKEALNKNS
jgi:predicted DNA-binding transcriptional regulator YafY